MKDPKNIKETISGLWSCRSPYVSFEFLHSQYVYIWCHVSKEAFVSCSSVTEWEIEQGLLATQTSDSTAVLFVRDIPKLRKKEMPKTLAPFTDVTVDGLVDSEAQELLSSLKTRLFSACASCSSCSSCSACTSSLHQHCVELSKAGFEPSRKEHAQYLDSLCEQFVCQMKEKIRQQAGGASLGVSDGGGAGQGQAEGWSLRSGSACAVMIPSNHILSACMKPENSGPLKGTGTRHATIFTSSTASKRQNKYAHT